MSAGIHNCFQTGSENQNHSTHSNANTTKTEENSTFKAFRAELKAEPAKIVPNQPVKLTVTIRDEAGAIVKDLQIVHEKPLHLLIVSDDLADFFRQMPLGKVTSGESPSALQKILEQTNMA